MCEEKILDEDVFGDGIEDLQNKDDDSIEIIIHRDDVSIPRRRYDELLRAENTLEILHRLLSCEAAAYLDPFLAEACRAIFGDRMPSKKAEEEEKE